MRGPELLCPCFYEAVGRAVVRPELPFYPDRGVVGLPHYPDRMVVGRISRGRYGLRRLLIELR